MASDVIPNRPLFRAQEVCDLVEVQPYVLRSWESEFPDLGVAKGANGPRVYRRADVERVLRIKQMVFVDGLTLAGARRKLSEEGAGPAPIEAVQDSDVAAMIDEETRQHLRDVRRGLNWILGVLSGHGVMPEDFVLTAGRSAPRPSPKRTPAPPARRVTAPKPKPSRSAAKAPKKPARSKHR